MSRNGIPGFSVSASPLDVDALRSAVAHPGHGGFCAFEGWVRDRNDGREVEGLEYEVYVELALAEGETILAEARERFGDIEAVGVHRSGRLRVGDLAVWVGVSSPHRDAAFRACRYIIDAFKHRLPVWKKELYLQGDTQWVVCSHGSADTSTDAHFVPDYSRQSRLREVGEQGQARLAAARVLVIGAGGLASPALTYLAATGIGTLGIVDGDRVEASNLHRQTLYTAADIGQPKAVVAAQRLRAQNPALSVKVFTQPLQARDVVDTFRQFDLVLECTDDMDSRYLSSDAAQVAGIPLILASVHQYEGQMQVSAPGGPCLRCLWPEPPDAGLLGSCAQSGVLGTVPGVLGTLQANEALKLLLDLPRRPPGELLLVDLLDITTQRLPIDPTTGCASAGGCAQVASRALGARAADADLERTAESLVAAASAGFQLVDLREADEREAMPSDVDTQWMPYSRWRAERFTASAGGPILLFCASGKRSLAAARSLRALGHTEAFSLQGGLRRLPQMHAAREEALHHPPTACSASSSCRHA